ncbi:MAG: NAD(P)/FAD-dependent oxidoreductase [Bacteroidales bacterium]|nr:NAD(P)/FAD-dependent oxidoreductase [Bacteroidales bacterium]
MKEFDIVIIGSGPAGFSAAMRALDYKKNICIIEAKEIGGAGIMNGALVSKTMWELSADYAIAGKTNRGYRASGLNVDFSEVRKTVIQAAKERQYQILSQIETFSSEKSETGSITLINGYAKFCDRYTVDVTHQNKTEKIKGKYFIIATGSKPREYPDLPVDGKHIFDSDTILKLQEFPERMVIIGSGIIGCEFATIFSNYKQTEVHLLDRTNRVIPYEDDDLSDFVSKHLEENGVNIHYQAHLRTIRKKNNYLEVVLDYDDGHSKVIEVDIALVAIGRIPNTENLGLENIGFEKNKKGTLKTDEFCEIIEIGKCNIFAAGDITGHGQLYNIAQVQGRYIIDSIFGKQSDAVSYKNMSTLMFFKPEVAAVGLNEKQLQQKGIPYKVASYSNALVSRTIAMRNTEGFVKIIVSNDGENKILGMRAASPQASAFIVSVAHLIDEKNGLNEVNKTVHPHPGVTEGIEECLRLFNNSSIFKPEAFPEHIKYKEWYP